MNCTQNPRPNFFVLAGPFQPLLLALTLALSACGTSTPANIDDSATDQPPPPTAESKWTTAWTRSQATSNITVNNETIRQITRVTGSGSAVRIRIQNTAGAIDGQAASSPLIIGSAYVGLRDSGANIVTGTNTPVLFAGQPSVTLLGGEIIDSDPVPLSVLAQDELAVSFFVDAPGSDVPSHLSAFVTSYRSGASSGDFAADESDVGFGETTTSTFVVTAVDVLNTALTGAIVAIGGSVVDGTGTDNDSYEAWPDVLSRRILDELPASQQKTVGNAGIGGTTSSNQCALLLALGPAAEDRLQRDVLSLADVSHVVVYAGTNDVAFNCTGDQIIDSYRSIVTQAHAVGAKVIIATVTPRGSYTDQQNIYREQVNVWNRSGGNCGGECDGIVDFDAAVRDPSNPNQINPEWDSGDGIHPNGIGYGLMANAFDLDVFAD